VTTLTVEVAGPGGYRFPHGTHVVVSNIDTEKVVATSLDTPGVHGIRRWRRS